jgi:hypothetical protein
MARAGIYMIINKIDNKKYIGSTISATEHRWSQHKSLLINNAHYNKHLQNSWNKYGSAHFDFIVIERCSDGITQKEIFDIETSHIIKNNTLNSTFGYNEALPGGGSKIGKPIYCLELSSNSSLCYNNIATATEATSCPRAKIYEAIKNNTIYKKRLFSYKYIEPLEDSMRLGMLNKKHYYERGLVAINTLTSECQNFESILKCSLALGLCKQNISAVLRKKRKSVGGFTFCDSREHISATLKWVVGEQS